MDARRLGLGESSRHERRSKPDTGNDASALLDTTRSLCRVLSMHPQYEGFLIVSLHVSVMHKYELGCGLVATVSLGDNSVLIIIHMDARVCWLPPRDG